MAETIRDVVIRLSIQQIDTALKTPDYSAIVAGHSVVAESAKKASSAIRDIGTSQVGASSISKQALEEARAQVKKWQDEVLGAADAAKQGMQSSAKAVAESAATSYGSAAEAAQQSAQQVASAEKSSAQEVVRAKESEHESAKESAKGHEGASKSIVESLKLQETATEKLSLKQKVLLSHGALAIAETAEGVVTFARGVALATTGVNSDLEDFEEQVKDLLGTVQNFQSAKDIISGFSGTMKGLSEAMHAVTLAGGVQKFTMLGLSGAYTVATASLAKLALAARAAWVAMTGPVGVIVGILTAVGAAAYYAWSKYSEGAKSAEENSKPIMTAADELAIRLSRLSDFKLKLGLDEELSKLDTAKSATQKLAELENRRIAIADELNKTNAKGAADSAAKDLDEITRKLRAGKKVKDSTVDSAQGEAIAALKLLEQEETLQETSLRVARDKLAVIKQQQSALWDSAKAQGVALDTARKAWEAEKGKVQSLQQQLGALNEIEFASVKNILEKHKAGQELNRDELDVLSQKGGDIGKHIVDQTNEKRGRGRLEQLSDLSGQGPLVGEGSKVDKLAKDYAKASSDALKTAGEALQKGWELRVKEQQQVAEISQQLQSVFATKGAIEELANRLREMETQQSRNQVGKK